MTATFHELGHGSDSGLYYVNDPDREARPRNRDEYYVSDGGGVWWSSSETVVTHGTQIVKGSFRDLCAGINPATGRALVRGAGEKHRAGWDLTFSAPKSVSVLWAMSRETERADYEGIHAQAVNAALAFVQHQQLLEVRLGAGGTIREQPSDLIIGKFQHYTSRAGDPQLHTHCVIMNVAGCADGKHRTLEPDAAFKWTHVIGAAYRAELSCHLVERGFRMRPAGQDQIEIAGIDEAILETFSERSRQIEELVGDRKLASGAQKQIAALATRSAKSEVPTGAVLEARWREDFAGREQSIRESVLKGGRAPDRSEVEHDPDDGRVPLDPVPVSGDSPVAVAASKLLTHESVVTRNSLTRRAMVEASLRGIGIDAVEAGLQAHEDRADLLTLRGGREALWTTRYIAEAEAAMRKAATRPDERLYVTPEALKEALAAAPHLTDEQLTAVADVANRDGVSLVEAGAGTGKTTIAKVIRQAAERSGLRVIALAPTWVAADELAKSTDIPAQVVASFRWNSRKRQSDEAFKLDARTVILLDEAGMLGTLDMSAVLVSAKRAGAKVIIFGDRRQLAAVAQGSALSAVADHLSQVATLKAIRRQTEPWQRGASIKMFEGDVAGAIADYWRKGAIRFAADARQAIDETVATWSTMRAVHGEVAMITRTNRDVATLNAAARQTLRDEGALPTEETVLPTTDRDNKRVQIALAIGDKIRFRENISRLSIRNGTRAVVTGLVIPPDGGDAVVSLRLEDGTTRTSPWMELTNPAGPRAKTASVPKVVHAYAGTTYSVQGRTVDAAVFHVGSRTDARETYVAMTRHRHDVAVVVDGSRLIKAFEYEVDADAVEQEQSNGTTDRQDPRLTALQEEAQRLDEKANVYSIQALPVERGRTREHGIER